MTLSNLFGRTGRTLAFATAVVGAVGLTVTAAPQPAHAIGTGAAVGIGLGAFALGTALASPYYNPYYAAPYGYYPPASYYPPAAYYPSAPAYYPSAPAYPAYRSCWSPYYRTYVAC